LKTFLLVLLSAFAISPGLYGQTIASEGGRYERIPAPDSFGKLVEEHVSQMYAQGYFRELSEKDFYHGHLVFRANSPKKFVSLKDVLANTVFVLYHTDEGGVAWSSQEALDPIKRRQRSIVGFSYGQVRPAIELFSARYEDFDHYACCGTIHAGDFWRLMPEQFGQDRPIRIVSRTKTRWLANQFMIYKTETGRYEVAGTRYDIYFEASWEKR